MANYDTSNFAFYLVFDFMVKILHLKGLRLVVYALVYSFWRTGSDMYYSTYHLAPRIGYSRERVNLALLELWKDGLLLRDETPTDQSTFRYSINEAILIEQVPGWHEWISDEKSLVRRPFVTGGSDLMSPSARLNVTSGSDYSSPNNSNCNRANISKEDRDALPLPKSCGEDKECRELTATLLKMSKWCNRPPEAIATGLTILGEYPVELARLMLRHTISGDYPSIYPPTEEMKNKIKRSDKKSLPSRPHTPTPDEAFDREVMTVIHQLLPKELNDSVYLPSPLDGMSRRLSFRLQGGTVLITCLPEVQTWLESIDIDPKLRAIVGDTYVGKSFNLIALSSSNNFKP